MSQDELQDVINDVYNGLRGMGWPVDAAVEYTLDVFPMDWDYCCWAMYYIE